MEKKSIANEILSLFFIIVLFFILGQIATAALFYIFGIPFSFDEEIISEFDVKTRQLARIALLIGHLISFTLSSFVYLYIFHRDNIIKFVRLGITPKFVIILLSIALVICSYPITIQLGEWNLNIPLPESLRSIDTGTEILQVILNMEKYSELALSILLVVLAPAIGEELLFRGIIQNKLCQLMNNDHLAILIASFLFGLIHFQMDKILPLTFLGLILGYTYYYSKNLWIPIILHAMNNGIQVLGFYFMHESIESFTDIEYPEMPLSILIISLISAIGLFFLLTKTSIDSDQ